MTNILQELRAIVGDSFVSTGDDTATYATGARYGSGRALCVVRPGSTEEVARVIECCSRAGVRLLAQGANTGLVGASTPDDSGTQVVISLARLRKHCAVDPVNRSVEVDAGMLLHELNDRLRPYGLWLPIDLGADPSIGGMVACNTGGARLLRHGDVRRILLGIEAVLFDPPGEVVRFGGALRKNNAGPDLMQLFVGTSGAAGVVTRATLEVAVRPRQKATALVVPADDDAVSVFLVDTEDRLGDFVTAFEAVSESAVHAALQHVPGLRNPFARGPIPTLAILVELTSSAPTEDLDLDALLLAHLERCLGAGSITDAVVGHGEELWKLRHAISEASRRVGRIIGFDISVRRGDVMRFRREASAIVASSFPHLRIVDFGHLGDGGLHFNLVWPHDCAPPWSSDVVERVRDAIYELAVRRFGGSFSAEHGVGPHNIDYYRKYTADAILRLAGAVQELLDPRGIGATVRFGPPDSARPRT